MIEYSRRDLIGKAAKGLAAVACTGLVGGIVYLSNLSGESKQPSQDQLIYRSFPTLESARSGLVSPQDYLNYVFDILPEAREARKSGTLKGLVYNPTDKNVEEIIRESIFSLPIADQREVLRIFEESYKTREKIAAVAPNVLGRRIPLYVIFTDSLLSEQVVQNDADVRSIARHELQHVRDQYYGIELLGLSLTDESAKNKIRPDFLNQLQELRAVYRELNDVFRERLQTGSFSISKDFFGAKASEYAAHWRFLENYPVVELEKKVRELQFEAFKGIVPRTSQEDIYLDFNLFGNNAAAEFIRRKPVERIFKKY